MARTTNDLSELSLADLVEELRESKQEALNLRFRNATGQLDNTAEITAGAPSDRPHQHAHPRTRDRRSRGKVMSDADNTEETARGDAT